MRTLPFIAFAAALQAATPASALDIEAAERRIEASLALPARLAPPSYLDVATVPRPMRPWERASDPTSRWFSEPGRWRVVTPIRVKVLGLVMETTGACYLLLFDNFAFPDEKKGRIQPSPIHRSLGL